MRFHQSWWRAFVLVENEGNFPTKKGLLIGNTILDGRVNKKNFLSENIIEAVNQTIHERQIAKSGIIEEDRLFNNLLSSQPLCFNFFGEMKIDTSLALIFLKQFWPELTAVKKVIFEYSPQANYTNDNSAFDVAFEVMVNNSIGLIGLECKYTDSFSSTEYDKEAYRYIFNLCLGTAFLGSYEEFKSSRFNQLFRNQLIAEALRQNKQYEFVYTGLFCHPDDESAQQTALDFQKMLVNGKNVFKIITFKDYIEKMQILELCWKHRELSMMLWARYCGETLSENAFIIC